MDDKARIVDTHAHLVPPHFSLEEIHKILSKNTDLSVIGVSENFKESQELLELARRIPRLFACAGLHPCHPDLFEDELDSIKEFIVKNQGELAGIGEVGLDFSPRVVGKKGSEGCEEKKTRQGVVLSQFARLLRELGLPMTIHSRNAGHHAIKLLKEENVAPFSCVLHAFDGKVEYALDACRHGFMFSIPPSVTRQGAKKDLLERIPLDNLLLESDSPALGPVPQERNTPENIRLTVNEIARTRGLSEEQVIQITTDNAKRVFSCLR